MLLVGIPSLLWAQPNDSTAKKHELGVNGSKIVGLLLGAEPGLQPWSIHYKQQLEKGWFRSSLRYENRNVPSRVTSQLEDSVLVNRITNNEQWAVAATLGLERRRALGKDWSFTYGADLVLRQHQSTWFTTERRYPEFTTNTDQLGFITYSSVGSTFESTEVARNEIRSQQVGAQISLGLHYVINRHFALHLQTGAGLVLSQNDYRSRNFRTGVASDLQLWSREQLPLPGFNEIALYYRF